MFPIFLIDNPRILCAFIIIVSVFFYYQYRVLHIDGDRLKKAICALATRQAHTAAQISEQRNPQYGAGPQTPVHPGFEPAAAACNQNAADFSSMFQEGPPANKGRQQQQHPVEQQVAPRQMPEPAPFSGMDELDAGTEFYANRKSM